MNWRRWLRRDDREANLERELSFHIEERVADMVRSGVREEDARRRVRLEFGAPEQVKDDCRDVRPARWAETFVQDSRYAWRNLGRNPSFAAVAIATLALGIWRPHRHVQRLRYDPDPPSALHGPEPSGHGLGRPEQIRGSDQVLARAGRMV